MAEEGKREVREKDIEPGIGDIPEKGIYGISPTIDPDLLEVNSVFPKKEGGITRHQFIVGASAAGGLLALTGCVPSPTPTETPIVTETTGIPPSPTLEIKTPTPEVTPSPTLKPTVSPTPEPTVTKEPTVAPKPTPTKEPTPAPEPCEVERCECYQNLALYHNPTEEESFSNLIPGTNKTFIVKERSNGWMLIEVREPTGATWEAWTNDVSGAYGPVGQRPTPTEVPPAYCEVPHWPVEIRTADRKTGVVIRYGNQRQEIYPEGNPTPPHYTWTRIEPDFNFVIWMRDGRITEIDRKNQIITFDLGGGLIVKRRFISDTQSDTQVVMRIHNTYSGMPLDEVWQTGGNLCDFEEGDAASILALSEGEVANPSAEGVAWGVYIVQ